MSPLKLVGWGFLVVFIDIRLDGLDVLPDFIGWLVAYVGVTRLRPLDSAFGTAAVAAAAEVALTAIGLVTGANILGYALDALASGVFVVYLCTGIMQRALAGGDPGMARSMAMIRGTAVVITAGALAATIMTEGDPLELATNGAASVLVGVVTLTGLAVMLWLLYLLFTSADRSYLDVTGTVQATGPARPAD